MATVSEERLKYRAQIQQTLDKLPNGYTVRDASRALGNLRYGLFFRSRQDESFRLERNLAMKNLRIPLGKECFHVEKSRVWIRVCCSACAVAKRRYALQNGCFLCGHLHEEMREVLGHPEFGMFRKTILAANASDAAPWGVTADWLDEHEWYGIGEAFREVFDELLSKRKTK